MRVDFNSFYKRVQLYSLVIVQSELFLISMWSIWKKINETILE